MITPDSTYEWRRKGEHVNIDPTFLSDQHESMFDEDASARADMIAGALYAVTGEGGWIYFGQVTQEKTTGFFERRDREQSSANDVLAAPNMAAISVSYPSITRALRNGRWKKPGWFPVVAELVAPRPRFSGRSARLK